SRFAAGEPFDVFATFRCLRKREETGRRTPSGSSRFNESTHVNVTRFVSGEGSQNPLVSPGGGPERPDRALAGQIVSSCAFVQCGRLGGDLCYLTRSHGRLLSTPHQPAGFSVFYRPLAEHLSSRPARRQSFPSPPSCSPGRISRVEDRACGWCTGGCTRGWWY